MNTFDQISWGFIANATKSLKTYSLIPTNGGGDFLFVRNGTKTRINESGILETVATGVPSLDYGIDSCSALYLEPSITNRFLNTATLSTQSVTVTAQAYTVSFYGTGTITFSGAYSGLLSGTGINNRVTITFTPSTGSVVCTVTGSVKNAQFQTGSFTNSYYPSTGSMGVSVADSVTTLTGKNSLIGQTEGTFYSEFVLNSIGIDKIILESNDGTTNNRVTLRQTASNTLTFNVIISGVTQGSVTWSTPLVSGTRYKCVGIYRNGYCSLFVNGIKIGQDTTLVLGTPNLSTISFKTASNTVPFYGYKFADLIYKIAISEETAIYLTQ